MKFPKSLVIKLNSEKERDALLAGLEFAGDGLRDGLKQVFVEVIGRSLLTDVDNAAIPEAYIEVAGKRIVEGSRSNMLERFDIEIASHSGNVSLFARQSGSAHYRAVCKRFSKTKVI